MGYAFLFAVALRDFGLRWVPFVGLLGRVGVAGGATLGLYGRDVDEFSGLEHRGVFGDFVIVKGEALAAFPPCV